MCLLYSKQWKKIFLVTFGDHASYTYITTDCQITISRFNIYILYGNRKVTTVSRWIPEKIGIYNTVSELCESIQEQTALVDNQLQTLNFFDQYQRLTKDLTKQSKKFLWFQLFKYSSTSQFWTMNSFFGPYSRKTSTEWTYMKCSLHVNIEKNGNTELLY